MNPEGPCVLLEGLERGKPDRISEEHVRSGHTPPATRGHRRSQMKRAQALTIVASMLLALLLPGLATAQKDPEDIQKVMGLVHILLENEVPITVIHNVFPGEGVPVQ